MSRHDDNDFKLGVALGFAVGSYKAKTKQPVAYLYNGVRLPKLPSWDKTVYPYAAIYIGLRKYLICSAEPFSMSTDSSGALQIGLPDNTAYLEFAVSGGAWVETNTLYLDTTDYPAENWLWTNTNILNEDGSVYLALSEPTPVYE